MSEWARLHSEKTFHGRSGLACGRSLPAPGGAAAPTVRPRGLSADDDTPGPPAAVVWGDTSSSPSSARHLVSSVKVFAGISCCSWPLSLHTGFDHLLAHSETLVSASGDTTRAHLAWDKGGRIQPQL